MRGEVTSIEVPAGSLIARDLPGAHFHDCHAMAIDPAGRSALALFLDVVARTPAWVNGLMALRNRVVAVVGLKNLGGLDNVSAAKPASAYRVGDRVGIFTLLVLTDDEVILGDSDKHLDVKVSVLKRVGGSGPPSVAVSTVVHIHNTLGRIYMLFVGPVHKLIVPAVLGRGAQGVGGASFEK